jgi:enamine deaminase RidA (YjgF/YER057c/UK114 family)
MSLEVTSDKQGNEAKQEAFDRAVEQASQRLTEELLGPEKAARVWPGVKAKVLKNSTRYVVFIKGSTPVVSGGVSKTQVQMRLSMDNLEALLRELGATGQATVKLLPLILVSETKGTKYVWWTDAGDDKATSLSKDIFKKIFEQVNAKFKGKNVYVLDPRTASFRMSVPSAYRSEGLRREDQALLGQYLKADIVISGRVDVVRGENGGSKVNYDLQMWQAKSGRGLTEMQRSDTVASDAPKIIVQAIDESVGKTAADFSAKLNEAMMNGSLNLNVMRLMVEGNLGPRQHSDLKKILGGMRDIKLIRERLFEPSRLTYEIETGTSSIELGKAIAKTQFPLFKVEVGTVLDNSLVLSVRSLSSSNAQ